MTEKEEIITKFLQKKAFVSSTVVRPLSQEARDWFEENKSLFWIVPTPKGTKSTVEKEDL